MCRTAAMECTLRAAIQQANATANLPDGPDQIGFLNDGRIDLTSELPTIVTDMEIFGPGGRMAVWGNLTVGHRIFSVFRAKVLIERLAISHGVAGGPSSPGREGGGIRSTLADLTLVDCEVLDNQAARGGGIYALGGT